MLVGDRGMITWGGEPCFPSKCARARDVARATPKSSTLPAPSALQRRALAAPVAPNAGPGGDSVHGEVACALRPNLGGDYRQRRNPPSANRRANAKGIGPASATGCLKIRV